MIIKIWQNSNVNVNEQPVKMLLNPNVQVPVLKQSYPPANLPLSDTDKIPIRQGSDWREVDKKNINKQIFTYDFGGYWIMAKNKYTSNNYYIDGLKGARTQSYLANSPVDFMMLPFVFGLPIQKSKTKVIGIAGSVKYGGNRKVRFFVGKKHYDNLGNVEASIIYEREHTLPDNSHWFIDINSDVLFDKGDEILFFTRLDYDYSTPKLYQFFNQVIMQ